MNNFVPSPYQAAGRDFVTNGVGNAVMVAVAGSGKTTTICWMLQACAGSSLFLAFNKHNATDLQRRGVNARTFHSVCYSPVLRARGASTVTADKLSILVDEKMSDEDARMYGSFARRMVGLARQAGVGVLVSNTTEFWVETADHHDIEPESDKADFARAIELSQRLFDASCKSKMVDFDDLLYFAVADGVSLPKFDWVFVDEAQDTNAIQRALIRKLMRPDTGRMVAVGDPAQAIYGFRGADSRSIGLIKDEFNCIELPLTISYRCPQAVVRHAQQWVSHIEAADTAPEGAVRSLGGQWTPDMFERTDMMVCRTTAPLVAAAYKFIRARVPVRILGREIGQGLVALVRRMRASTIEQLTERLSVWAGREIEKATAKKNEAKAAAVQDQFDTIHVLLETLPEDSLTIDGLIQAITDLFADKTGCVTLSTIHKSKGLEAPRVWWLNSSKCPAKWARRDWQREAEVNLCYVATTRAMNELILIEEK